MNTKQGRWKEPGEQEKFNRHGKARERFLAMLVAVVLLGLPGCVSLGANGESDREASRDTAETAIDREVAELVKLYRMCLQKNEDNPVRAKENCGMYKEAIRDLSPASLRTVVGELLDGLRDNCEKPGTGGDSET